MTKLSINLIPRVSLTVTKIGKAKTNHQRKLQKTETAQETQESDKPST